MTSRNVLVVTGGTSPQVVTETVFALARREPDPFVPNHIISIVTKSVAQGFDQVDSRLHELAREWDIPETWKKVEILIPPQPDGGFLDDVRTHAQTVVFGDFVSEVVRKLTEDAAVRVHLCLAGGRKTMSYYGGAAMGVWGRLGDELSHVLVGVSAEGLQSDPVLRPEEFENHPDFWYPSREDRLITTRADRVVNARYATIDLSEAPFVPLRGLLPPWLLETSDRLSYAAWVERFRAALSPRLELHLSPRHRRVRIGKLADFRLEPLEFAFYQLMAEWVRDQHPGAGPEGIGPEHRGWLSPDMFANPESVDPNPVARLIDIYGALFAEDPDTADAKEKELRLSIKPRPGTDDDREHNRKYPSERLSRIRKAVAGHLVLPALCERFAPPVMTRKGGLQRFGLLLLPQEITIEQ